MSDASQPLPASKALAVIGAGAWGTTLAVLLARTALNGEVILWARRPEFAEQLRKARENRPYLPGLALPETLRVTSALEEVETRALFIAVPSKGLRYVMEQLPRVPTLICCAKGLELGSFKRFSEVLGEYQPDAALAALSGPNLAKEIAAGLPASATVASGSAALAEAVQGWLSGPTFRVYTSHDIIGVEVSGALKNVIALAAGMCDGLGLGDNAKATIITRGLAEIVRLGTHLGGEMQTFYGLAGLGDLVATCSSPGSRNHSAGVRLAQGATLADLERDKLNAEGIPTVRAVVTYAEREGLELPISAEVYRVIFEKKSPRQALHDLMTRGTKAEWE